jgi:succinoglycan biosynthesis protein ExoL
VEGRLLHGVDLVLVSSPAFVTHHFANRPGLRAPVLLVENKLLALDAVPLPQLPRPGPPWTIGWFGMLRCKRTLATLIEVARAGEGRIEVLIAGKPSAAIFADFEAQVAAALHCRYVGPYARGDLAALYGQCHFAWAIDWFEEGLNSNWLLPNRLYEAGAFGVVPIALASVETGRWLTHHKAGMLLDAGDAGAQIMAALAGLDDEGYRAVHGAIAAIPRAALIAGKDDCRALLAAVAGYLP